METIDELIARFLRHGYGSGYGSGDGSGSGSGSGSGYGYGSGYGVKTFCGHTVYLIDDVQTIIYAVRGDYARGAILCDDLTLSPCFIAKVGNSFAHGETLRQARQDAEKKEMESLPLEVRLRKFKDAFPQIDSEASCRTFYDWHHLLTGSCTMGRDEFVKAHDLYMDKRYTVGYFIDITESAYGGKAIRELRKMYEP